MYALPLLMELSLVCSGAVLSYGFFEFAQRRSLHNGVVFALGVLFVVLFSYAAGTHQWVAPISTTQSLSSH